MNMSQNKRNGTIDILRFLFCIGILMFHIEKYIFEEPSLKNGIHFDLFPHGSIGVEFFFLVTGWLMAKSICNRKKSNNEKNLSSETCDFIKRKYLSILPYSVVATLFVFIVNCFVKNWGVKEIIVKFVESIPNFFIVQMTGISYYNPNHITWYLSSMMIAICILFPLAYKYYDSFVKLILPIGGVIVLGIMFIEYGKSLTGVMTWTGFAYKGTIRGIIEIGFGMVSFEVSQYLQRIKFNKKDKYLLGFVEIICYVGVFMFIMMTFPKSLEVMALATIWVGVTITFSGVTRIDILDNKLSGFLGKISLPIYLCQLAAINIVQQFPESFNGYLKIILVVVLDFIFAALCQFIGEKLLNVINKRKFAVNVT